MALLNNIQEKDMGKLIDTITITELDNGTFDVYCKCHDETENCASYPEALKIFGEFFGGMKDLYNDGLIDEWAFTSGYEDRPDL
jgi:hypothetical protein